MKKKKQREGENQNGGGTAALGISGTSSGNVWELLLTAHGATWFAARGWLWR